MEVLFSLYKTINPFVLQTEDDKFKIYFVVSFSNSINLLCARQSDWKFHERNIAIQMTSSFISDEHFLFLFLISVWYEVYCESDRDSRERERETIIFNFVSFQISFTHSFVLSQAQKNCLFVYIILNRFISHNNAIKDF